MRELTKLYEEYQRGVITELLAYWAEHSLNGECLIIVSGNDSSAMVDNSETLSPVEDVKRRIEADVKPNQAIKAVAKERGLNRQELYQEYHELT